MTMTHVALAGLAALLISAAHPAVAADGKFASTEYQKLNLTKDPAITLTATAITTAGMGAKQMKDGRG